MNLNPFLFSWNEWEMTQKYQRLTKLHNCASMRNSSPLASTVAALRTRDTDQLSWEAVSSDLIQKWSALRSSSKSKEIGKIKAMIRIRIRIILIIMGGVKGDFEPGRAVSLVIIVVEKAISQTIVFITRTLPSTGYLQRFSLDSKHLKPAIQNQRKTQIQFATLVVTSVFINPSRHVVVL